MSTDNPPRTSVTGVIAAAPGYGDNVVIIILDATPEPRKFFAGERVTIHSGGQP